MDKVYEDMIQEFSEEEEYSIWVVQPDTIDVFLITEIISQLPEKARRDYLRKQMEYQRMVR